MSNKKRKKHPDCPNCNTQLRAEFEFCPKCGQENHDLRLPFGHFLYEFVENITHFDTKLWNTVKAIVTKPGKLTKDFVEGKRARYVNPARFYVFVSVLFFALVSIDLDRSSENSVTDTTNSHLRSAALKDILKNDYRLGNDSLYLAQKPLARVPIDQPHYRAFKARLMNNANAFDSLLSTFKDTAIGTRRAMQNALTLLPDQDSLNVVYEIQLNGISLEFDNRSQEDLFRAGPLSETALDTMLGANKDSWFERRILKASSQLDLSSAEGKKRLGHGALKAISVTMFFLMPFTAFLLYLTYSRKRFFWEHLIFSIHTHTIFFLYFSVISAIGLLFKNNMPPWITLLAALSFLVYLLVSLRNVYGTSWVSTLWRFVLMAIPYLVVTIALIAGGFLWGYLAV